MLAIIILVTIFATVYAYFSDVQPALEARARKADQARRAKQRYIIRDTDGKVQAYADDLPMAQYRRDMYAPGGTISERVKVSK